MLVEVEFPPFLGTLHESQQQRMQGDCLAQRYEDGDPDGLRNCEPRPLILIDGQHEEEGGRQQREDVPGLIELDVLHRPVRVEQRR